MIQKQQKRKSPEHFVLRWRHDVILILVKHSAQRLVPPG